MPITDPTTIAQILFAETKDMVDDTASAARLSDLRKWLAWMISRSDGGLGWAPAVDPGVGAMATPAQLQAWQDCNAAVAAMAAPASIGGLQPDIAFWHTDSPTADPQLQRDLGWVFSGQGWILAGSVKRAGNVWKLWLDAGTQAPRTGRWPDNVGPQVVKGASLVRPGFPHSWIGVALFLSMLALLMIAGWYAQPEQTYRNAYSEAVTRQLVAIEEADKTRRKADIALAEASALKTSEAGDAIKKASQDVEVATAEATKARTALTKVEVVGGGKLLWQWPLAFVALLGLFAVVGYAVTGQVLGFLVDDRRRMSLARVQAVSWTLLVLSAYWIASAWNLWLAAKLQGPDLPLLPKLDTELWALLGITLLGSPLLSALILDVKVAAADSAASSTSAGAASATKPPQATVEDTTNKGPLDARTRIGAWSFLDLFTGETTINRETVDVSRLQQFVFTLIALLAFGALTYAMFDGLSGRVDALPKVSGDLVALLGLSHLTYLGVKSVQK